MCEYPRINLDPCHLVAALGVFVVALELENLLTELVLVVIAGIADVSVEVLDVLDRFVVAVEREDVTSIRVVVDAVKQVLGHFDHVNLLAHGFLLFAGIAFVLHSAGSRDRVMARDSLSCLTGTAV